jgi:MFS family permease
LRTIVNPFAVLRAPGVARLWFAGFAVGVMRWLELLAYALFVLELTGSPFLVALTAVARMLPFFLMSVPIASFAEGRDHRRLLMLGFSGMALISAGLLALAAAGQIGAFLLIAASFANGVFWTLEQTLRRAMLAEAGGSARLASSMGIEVASNQLTRLIGAVAGGAIVAMAGIAGVFLLGLLLYAAGAVLVHGFTTGAAAPKAAARASFLTAVREGLRFARRDRRILAIVAVTVVFNLFAFPYVALVPVYGEDVLALGPVGVGLLLGMEALGGFIASILIAAGASRAQFTRIYALGPAVFMIFAIFFSFTQTAVAAYACLFLAGFGIACFASMQAALPLTIASPEMRVRTLGVITMSIGVSPLGFFHAGLIGEWLGAAAGVRVIAIEGLLALLLVVRLWPELLRELPPPAPAPATVTPSGRA